MERRNFLGIAALLGLAPMLSKNVFTEEQGAPGIVKAKTLDGEEYEFVIPDNTFEIEVIDATIEVKGKKRNKLKMSGTGKIWETNGVFQAVTWKTDFFIPPCVPNITINGEQAKLHSIHQKAPNTYDLFADEVLLRHAVAFWDPPKTYLICEKI